MDTHYGYAGNILKIDLTTQSVSVIPLPDPYRQQLLGGKALAAQLLWEQLTGQEAALSEENLVVIATAPLTGSGAPGSARFDIASLSAKDDLPAFSNCGGAFGVSLRKAGYDALILKGKCERPSWLEISGQAVTFHDAASLWGMGTEACRKALQENSSDGCASLCIGPAGENLVKYASVLADGHSLGRAGFGAVLGWKQLKAITVCGQKEIAFADSRSVAEQNRLWYEQLRASVPTPPQEDHCSRCPLYCVKHNRGTDPILDDLGMDAMEAQAVLRQAAKQGLDTAGLYNTIAFRREIGDSLSISMDRKRKSGNNRRKVSYTDLAVAFDLAPDTEETTGFCKNLIEAVSVCGQCIFTVKALQPGPQEWPLLKMMESVTGQPVSLTALLRLGAYSSQLEQQLRQRFEHKK